MVDPNRKINNNLSDDDAAFLVECEQEFRHRYTEVDEEFAAFLAKPTRPPPIVEPWASKPMNNRHYGDSGNNWNRNNYRHNNRNHYNRPNDNRSQRPYQANYRQHYNRPYDRNFRRAGDSGNSGNSGHGSSHTY